MSESKPVLYVFFASIWAAVPQLALPELGYAPDAVEKKSVNLAIAENLSPSFYHINHNATLPTLVVGGKTVGHTTDEVTKYLIQHAPKPVPIGKHQAIIDRIHEDNIDPNFPFLGARSAEELSAKANNFPGEFVRGRFKAVETFNETADAELKAWYATKLPLLTYLNNLYTGAADSTTVEAFIDKSVEHMDRVSTYIADELPLVLPASGFIEGPAPGEADFHVAAWLARIALIAGAQKTPEGLDALEKELGQSLPEKVKAYWTAWSARPSWVEVYEGGLH